MNSEQLAQRVKQLEADEQNLLRQLEQAFVSTRGDLTGRAIAWTKGEVDRRIDDHPEVIESLGSDRIRAMKSDLAELESRLPQIIEDLTGPKARIPHSAEPAPRQVGGRYEEPFFNAVFRSAISHLGTILDRYGLLVERLGYIATWERKGPETFRYAINPGCEFRKIWPHSFREFWHQGSPPLTD